MGVTGGTHLAVKVAPSATVADTRYNLGLAGPLLTLGGTWKAVESNCVPVRYANGRRSGPRPLSAILPEVLLRLGVRMVESSAPGETDPT
jgi:hypothetical protein